MGNFPKYQIKKSINNQFYWVLYAVNGKIILPSSEQYISKQGCQNGIASSKRSVADSNFKRLTAQNGQYYFLQRANNHEPLGRSEMYESSYARDNGIDAVKRDAPIATVEDTTVGSYV